MASNYLLFNFQILSAIFALMILISTLFTKLISRNEKIVLTLLVLTLITSPAYLALSIYFEIHPFASLLIILLWCFLDAKKYAKNNYFLNSILLIIFCSTLSLARFEGFYLQFLFYISFFKLKKIN